MAATHQGSRPFVPDPVAAMVRYQVKDLERAVAFYTQHLGFRQATGPDRSRP